MSARSWMERLGTTLGFGIVGATRVDRGQGRGSLAAQVQLAPTGENRDDLPMMGLYGVSSRPRGGADALVAFFGGNRSSGVVIATGDGRFTVELKEGEVAVHTHEGTKVHLKVGAPLLINAPHGVEIVSPTLTHNGRNIGESHKHRDVEPGAGTSGEPLE